MNHMRRSLAATALALTLVPAAAMFVLNPVSRAQAHTADMGTLTCVLSPASEEPFGVERELSCDFEPLIGAGAKLRGVVHRVGASVADTGQIVMVWTVFGPSLETPADQLEGRYVGSLGTEAQDGLIGGVESSIRLKPLAAGPDLDNAALSILELELSVMKA